MIALIAAAGLLGVGMIFSSSFGAAQVAGQARLLHWTNATLGTVGIARASVAQAVFFSFDSEMGGSGSDAMRLAIAEAELNLDAVESIFESAETPARPIRVAIEGFLTDAEGVIFLAQSNEPSRAEYERLTVLEPSFETVEVQLADLQTELAGVIAESEASAGRVSRFTQLAITFALPALVMLAFWIVLRRRVKKRESVMQSRLDAERRLNKDKNEFIAGLSHELRTPLTTIFGFSEVLLDEGGLDSNATELVGHINAGAADLSRMVDDLLAAARMDADALTTRPQTVDLAEQIDIVTAPYLRAEENLDLRTSPVQVYADPLHVRQIIHNLVSNARRHGGDRTVISCSERAGKAVLIVADDGEGVSAEAREKLFQRFSNRGREALVAGSVGLGLAISQELAMRMGGHIRYEYLDGWATFSLSLQLLPKIVLPEQAAARVETAG